MFECSWIRGVVLAAASTAAVGFGVGLLATSVATPAPDAAPRQAVLFLPQDGAGALVTVRGPGP
ncbi:hypothetical protein [Streptomyces sp. NRRL F-2664]|uniref:hypothetical protein n=1 Tax=Streptomyces sp. NRRL F-2664 TaxID=1463842 RepID=UPI0004C7F2DE|nr:hypothetical protein [Streptomyces sp. NRRL F-2664]